MKQSARALTPLALVMAVSTMTASAQVLPRGAELLQGQLPRPLVQLAACRVGAAIQQGRCPYGSYYACRRPVGTPGNVCKCVPCS